MQKSNHDVSINQEPSVEKGFEVSHKCIRSSPSSPFVPLKIINA
jgi:hypothetical protein